MILRCYKCKHAWKDEPVEGQTAFECPKCATLVLVGDFTETTALPRPASLKKSKGPVMPEDQPIAPAARLASGTPIEAAKAARRPHSDETQDFSKVEKDINADATDTSRFPPIPDPGYFVDKEPSPGDATPPAGVAVPPKPDAKKPAPPKPTAMALGASPKPAPKPMTDDADGPEDLSDMPTSLFRPELLTDPKATQRKGPKKAAPPPKPAPRVYDEDEEVRPEELPSEPTRVFSIDAPDAPPRVPPPAPAPPKAAPVAPIRRPVLDDETGPGRYGLNEEPTRVFSASELTAQSPAAAREDDGGTFGINDEPTRMFSAAELTAMEGQATSIGIPSADKLLHSSLENEKTRIFTAAELMAMEGQADPEATLPPPMAPPAPKPKKAPEPALPPLPTQVFSTRDWNALHPGPSDDAPEEQTLSPFAPPPKAAAKPAPPKEELPPITTRVFSTRDWDAMNPKAPEAEPPEEQTLSPFAPPPKAAAKPAPPKEELPPLTTRVFSSRTWEALDQPPLPPPPPPAAKAEPRLPEVPTRLAPRSSMLEEELDAKAARIPGATDAISTADTQPEEVPSGFPSMGAAMRRDTVDPSKLATRPITPGVGDALGKKALETPLETILTEGKTPTPKQWVLEPVSPREPITRPEDARGFDADAHLTQVSSGPPPGLLAALLETDLPIANPTPVPKKIRNLIDEELGDFT